MAITFVVEHDSQSSSGTISFANPNTVAVGDLWVALIGWPGASSNHTPTITDNLNVGAWNLPASTKFVNIGINIELMLAWIRCDTAGTPTITASALGADFTNLCTLQFTGFVNSPALVTADISTNSGTGTTLSASGFSNSVTNELTVLLSACGAGGVASGLTGSFTNQQNSSGCVNGQVIKATSGNALSFGATNTSNNWGVMLASFQDQPSAPPPFTPFTKTQFFVTDTLVQM